MAVVDKLAPVCTHGALMTNTQQFPKLMHALIFNDQKYFYRPSSSAPFT
jgi:hypothetical protein